MAKKHGLAKRILDGADAFASLFSGGELAVLGAFAALLGGSVMRRSRYRRLTRRRVKQQFDQTITRICAALAEEAQSAARDTLVHAYEATAEEISAFAEEFAADSERMQREMTEIVDDLTRQINNSIEIELRHMRRDTDDVYRQVIEQARGDWLSPGNASRLNAEVQNAINEFAGRGVTGFTDRAGRRWGLYEYANMAMRTAIHRAGLQATIDAMRASGYDLAYITRHPGACPLCERWYGTILSISGNDPTHPSLQGAMDQGLFHPNCADVLQVYFPGVSDLTAGMGEYTPEQSAERYAASQRQRALEREIRKWKRMQAAAIAPEQERVAKAHIDRLQRQLRILTGETKLPRRYDREGGRVRLSEAARKIKPFTIDEKGSIIDSRGERAMARIGSPIEQRNSGKGNPNAILHFDRPLNRRQTALLDALPEFDSRTTVRKRDVNMRDLAALTAHTGDEYAMFTRKGERLIIRGNAYMTNISAKDAEELAQAGFRWSGHTHPGTDINVRTASPGDIEVLKAFGQEYSLIFDAVGRFEVFRGD